MRPLIGIVVVALVYGIVFGPGKVIKWFRRKRNTEVGQEYAFVWDADTSKIVKMTPPLLFLTLGLLLCVFFFGLTAIMFAVRHENETVTPISLSGLAGFGLLGFPFLIEFVRARHEITNSELKYRRWFGSGTVSWNEIARVRFGKHTSWFKLTDSDGRTIRVSLSATNTSQFAEKILQHVPLSAIDQSTLDVLKQTAEGKPPKWM